MKQRLREALARLRDATTGRRRARTTTRDGLQEPQRLTGDLVPVRVVTSRSGSRRSRVA